MKKLVIVESPSKSKTLEKYLGSDYKVVSSKGHIRDLSTRGKYGLGVDLENNFKPDYVAIKGKSKVITDLKKDAREASHIYLASDPDREGEAISWHLYDALGLNDKNTDRIVFNEITKNAVLESLKHTRKVDQDMVNSQETRRILDRIIGFRLSKLMQAKTNGKSAGRVQSVALKLIVDREREIEAFIKEEYWTITGVFNEFEADLFKYKEKELKLNNELEATEVLNKLDNTFKIEDVSKSKKKRKSKYPFTTSTLQQEASIKLGFPSKKTMSIAQKLYEGIELEDETVGLITYMRTDSIRLSDEFIKNTYKYIDVNYGKKYVGYVKVAKKKDNVQDAHEAVRPTSILREPNKIKKYLTSDEYKLYSLIYVRALASLMSDADTELTTIILDNNDYKFKTTGTVVTFKGYLEVYTEYEDQSDKILPDFSKYKSNVLISKEIKKDQHFTKPKPRYTEAKLIKEMEELGIGRPSTYSKTIDTLKSRTYVNIVDKKFIPTEIGIEITDKLQESFNNIINVEYTANMENDLDEIADGKKVWYQVLDKFYKDFDPALQKAFESLPKKEVKETGELCPLCGSPLVIRKGKYGEFTACSNYPKCKYVKQEKKEEKIICKCPNCEEGNIVVKHTKKGKIFYGCNNYPKCKTAYWDLPIGELCPDCNSMLVTKNNKVKCSSCTYER